MATLQTIYQTVTSNGEYSCGDLGISAQDWLELLQSSEAKRYLETLFCFLREQEHTSTCNEVSLK